MKKCNASKKQFQFCQQNQCHIFPSAITMEMILFYASTIKKKASYAYLTVTAVNDFL